MEGHLATAQERARGQIVGWRDIPDLVALIRYPSGARCRVQAVLLRWLLDAGADYDTSFDTPSMAAIAKATGEARQSISQAFHSMRRRGVLAAVPRDGVRGYRVTVHVPETRQLSLFAGPG